MTTKFRLAAAGLLLVTLFAAGCGSPGQISGKVRFDRRPVPSGAVLFYNAKGDLVGKSALAEDGSYRVADVPAGKVTVCVWSNKRAPEGLSNTKRQPDFAAVAPKTPPAPDRDVHVPERYSLPETSGLTCEVKGGAQTHDIDLP
jgi:hypothetical protein